MSLKEETYKTVQLMHTLRHNWIPSAILFVDPHVILWREARPSTFFFSDDQDTI